MGESPFSSQMSQHREKSLIISQLFTKPYYASSSSSSPPISSSSSSSETRDTSGIRQGSPGDQYRNITKMTPAACTTYRLRRSRPPRPRQCLLLRPPPLLPLPPHPLLPAPPLPPRVLLLLHSLLSSTSLLPRPYPITSNTNYNYKKDYKNNCQKSRENHFSTCTYDICV